MLAGFFVLGVVGLGGGVVGGRVCVCVCVFVVQVFGVKIGGNWRCVCWGVGKKKADGCGLECCIGGGGGGM